MRVLSLFSGVGGFDMGLEAAGMTTVFQCEIDKHARAVLDYHWPDVPKWDDVSTLTGAHILEATGGVDVVAWGSPCQDLSLAGKRAGLSGERSGLFHEGIRIIKELRELSSGQYPTWSVWENVVGALSSNGGADFGEVLYEMDEAGACFSEWVVLDAQYFGVPQRRRRVFVTSCFDSATSERCGSPLFPVAKSLPGHFAKGKPPREGTSGETSGSVGAGGGTGTYAKSRRAQTVEDVETWVVSDVTPTLNVFGVGDTRATTAIVEPVAYSIREDATANNFSATEIETARALQALQPSVQSHHAQTFVTQPLLVDGRRVDDVRVYTEPVQTLQERMGTGGNNVPVVAQDAVAIPIDTRNALRDPDKLDAMNRQGLGVGKDGEPSPTVTNAFVPAVAQDSVAIPIQDGREITKQQNGMGVSENGAPAYTLDQTGAQAVAHEPIVFQPGSMSRLGGHVWEGGPAPTLRAESKSGDNEPHVAQENNYRGIIGSNIVGSLAASDWKFPQQQQVHENKIVLQEQPMLMRQREGKPGGGKGPLLSDSSLTLAGANDQTLFQPVAYDEYNDTIADVHHALRAGTKQSTGVLESNLIVRRLTPLECERLMGWPDNHTATGTNGPISDTNRYKMCGNGVASPVAQWIGEHLMSLRSNAGM